MSHEASSISDFIRPGDVFSAVKLGRLDKNHAGPFAISSTNWRKKEQASASHRHRADGLHGPDVLGMVAEMELGFIRDRQRAGIEAAKAKRIYKGRPATFDRPRIVALREEGMGATEIAKAVG